MTMKTRGCVCHDEIRKASRNTPATSTLASSQKCRQRETSPGRRRGHFRLVLGIADRTCLAAAPSHMRQPPWNM